MTRCQMPALMRLMFCWRRQKVNKSYWGALKTEGGPKKQKANPSLIPWRALEDEL